LLPTCQLEVGDLVWFCGILR